MKEKVIVSTGQRKRNNRLNLGGFQATTMDFCHNKVLFSEFLMPGDKANLHLSHVLQMSPLVGAVVGKCNLEFKSYFVPCRLALRGFEELMDNMQVVTKSGNYDPKMPLISNVALSNLFMQNWVVRLNSWLSDTSFNAGSSVPSPWKQDNQPTFVNPWYDSIGADNALVEAVAVCQQVDNKTGKPRGVLHITHERADGGGLFDISAVKWYLKQNAGSALDSSGNVDGIYDGEDYDFIGMFSNNEDHAGLNMSKCSGGYHILPWQFQANYMNTAGEWVTDKTKTYPYVLFRFTTFGKRLFDFLNVMGCTLNFCTPTLNKALPISATRTNTAGTSYHYLDGWTFNDTATHSVNYTTDFAHVGDNMSGVYTSVDYNLFFNLNGTPDSLNPCFDLTRFNSLKLLSFMKVYEDYLCPSYWSKDFHYLLTPYLDGKDFTCGDFLVIVRYLLMGTYDKDYFTSAWLEPNSPTNNLYTPYKHYGSDGSTTIVNNNDVVGDGYGTDANTFNTSVSFSGELTKTALDMLTAIQKITRIGGLAGSRYIDQLYARFGVKNPNSRLQRSELIDVMRSSFDISYVMSNASTETASLGDYTAHGTSNNGGSLGHYEATEWGVLVVVASIIPYSTYYQGRQRTSLYENPQDFYAPELDAIDAMQSVRMDELLADHRSGPSYVVHSSGNSGSAVYEPNGTFGYSRLFAEMKKGRDLLNGDFRLNSRGKYTNSAYHLFREIPSLNQLFASHLPLVNSKEFNLCEDGSQFCRVFQLADSEYDHFYMFANVDCFVTRNVKSMNDFTFDDECDSVDRSINNSGKQM